MLYWLYRSLFATVSLGTGPKETEAIVFNVCYGCLCLWLYFLHYFKAWTRTSARYQRCSRRSTRCWADTTWTRRRACSASPAPTCSWLTRTWSVGTRLTSMLCFLRCQSESVLLGLDCHLEAGLTLRLLKLIISTQERIFVIGRLVSYRNRVEDFKIRYVHGKTTEGLEGPQEYSNTNSN